MLPKHFLAMMEGHFLAEYRRSAEMRKLSYFTIAPHLDPKVPFQQFCQNYWPLEFDELSMPKPPEIKPPSKEEFMRIMKLHNPNFTGIKPLEKKIRKKV